MATDDDQTLNRRRLLQIAGALSATGTLGGCSLFVRKPTPVCPTAPEVSRPKGPLTIDAHCHVFNGSDLQVNGFITKILAKQGGPIGVGARAIGPLLEGIGWQVAPSGKAEMKSLAEIGREMETCFSQQHQARILGLREQAYNVGRATIRTALSNSAELQQLKQRVQMQGLDLGGDEVARARYQLILEIEDLPVDVQNYKALRDSRITLLTHQRSARGMLDFVLQNFQYRYVSVYDYLSTYDKPASSRFIDLMLPSMVDYDYWLADGRPTPTNLQNQVDVMESVSIVTGGRVHAFVPFDPLREVAFGLKHAPVDSFTLATEAVERRGCVGVKLYPPMGFAAYGNAELPPGFWRRPQQLPSWTDNRDMGDLLDKAMLNMLSWCAANEVPVMAHTALSNGPSKDFEALASSKYWSKALDQVKGLRVSFGHFGDSSLGSDGQIGLERAKGFTALMGAGAQARGRNAYADAGYFVEGLQQEQQFLAALRQLYEQTAPDTAPLSTRFMYGTDWEMTLAEGSVINSYLDRFVAILNEMEQRPAIRSQGVSGLADRFFGQNAATWIGLRAGERARDRLEKFYKAKSVPRPDWMHKLDDQRL